MGARAPAVTVGLSEEYIEGWTVLRPAKAAHKQENVHEKAELGQSASALVQAPAIQPRPARSREGWAGHRRMIRDITVANQAWHRSLVERDSIPPPQSAPPRAKSNQNVWQKPTAAERRKIMSRYKPNSAWSWEKNQRVFKQFEVENGLVEPIPRPPRTTLTTEQVLVKWQKLDQFRKTVPT